MRPCDTEGAKSNGREMKEAGAGNGRRRRRRRGVAAFSDSDTSILQQSTHGMKDVP